MRKTILLSAAIGTVMVGSAGATAGYLSWKNPSFAEVVSVDPVREMSLKPDKACRDEQRRRQKAATQDELRASGTVIDGMAGGAINTEPRMPADKDSFNTPAGKHCLAANRVVEKVVAYDVRYRLHGKTSKVRMDHDPGQQLRVRDGTVVLTRDIAKRPASKA
ncbi:MAG TPA: hypothetical protein VHB46_01280 [Burkholderiales bacterium]|nr:hypothetical protein [Burkholderiales bacterium]